MYLQLGDTARNGDSKLFVADARRYQRRYRVDANDIFGEMVSADDRREVFRYVKDAHLPLASLTADDVLAVGAHGDDYGLLLHTEVAGRDIHVSAKQFGAILRKYGLRALRRLDIRACSVGKGNFIAQLRRELEAPSEPGAPPIHIREIRAPTGLLQVRYFPPQLRNPVWGWSTLRGRSWKRNFSHEDGRDALRLEAPGTRS